MPNHVVNHISLQGDRQKIREVLEAIQSDEHGLGSLDFNKVIPMLESLGIEAGSRTNRGLDTDVLDRAVMESSAQFYAAHREPEPQQTLFDMEDTDDFLYEPEDYDEYEPDEDEQAMDESDPFYFSEGMHL